MRYLLVKSVDNDEGIVGGPASGGGEKARREGSRSLVPPRFFSNTAPRNVVLMPMREESPNRNANGTHLCASCSTQGHLERSTQSGENGLPKRLCSVNLIAGRRDGTVQ